MSLYNVDCNIFCNKNPIKKLNYYLLSYSENKKFLLSFSQLLFLQNGHLYIRYSPLHDLNKLLYIIMINVHSLNANPSIDKISKLLLKFAYFYMYYFRKDMIY